MKILVTGGAGFIGSNLTRQLLLKNEKVICIDNFNDYYDVEFKEENVKEFLENKNYKLYRTDICNFKKLEKIFSENKIDAVIHLAARAGVRPSIEEPVLYNEVNVMGTVNLLELAKRYNVKNFVSASSSSVYGNNKKVPFSETDNVDFPISPYAATKKAGELACYTYHDLYDLNIACLRFFTVYGPCGRPDMAPYIFTKLISEGEKINMYGDGTTSRDYTYIDDIVSGIISVIDYVENNKNVYEIFNLGNSNTVKLKEFISIVENLVGKKAIINKMPMQPGDVERTFADISKAKKLLGYDPKTKFEDGMAEFVQWYKENRE